MSTHRSGKMVRPQLRCWSRARALGYDLADRVKAQVDPGLLSVTMAPLWDGVFASMVATGQLSVTSADGTGHSLVFGIVGGSGGGALAAALTLEGTRRRQLRIVLNVYWLIGVSILLPLALVAWTRVPILPELRVVCALALVMLALAMVGRQFSLKLLPYAITLLLTPIFYLTHYLAPRLDIVAEESSFELGPALAGSLVSWGTGLLVTAMAVFCRPWLERFLVATWLNFGGAVAILAIALAQLGVPTPVGASFYVFVAVMIAGPFSQSRRIRRLRCLPRAYRIQRIRYASQLTTGGTS